MALNARGRRGIVPPTPTPRANGTILPIPTPRANGTGPAPGAFPTTRIRPEHSTVSHLIACADGTYDVVDTHITHENGSDTKVSCERLPLQAFMYDRNEVRKDE